MPHRRKGLYDRNQELPNGVAVVSLFLTGGLAATGPGGVHHCFALQGGPFTPISPAVLRHHIHPLL